MRLSHFLFIVLALAAAGGLALGAYTTRASWLPHLTGPEPAANAEGEGEHDHGHGEENRVELSPQARANLGLDVRPVRPGTYWKKIWVPAVVIDRPGQSDRGLTAPVSGVVSEIRARPGDTVAPGSPLFTIRILSETVQNAQAELYKTMEELEITAAQRKLLRAGGEAIAEARLIELDNQEKRLRATATALRQELSLHGLRPGQIERVAKGDFATEVVVSAPEPSPDDLRLLPKTSTKADQARLAFEVKDLQVHLGDQVRIGQTLCLLANHQALFIEGHAFKD
ncbi:MAG TPA: HlyD family efflux transporter periplasmic adaptor subunit, partial [Gemmataceae bacterium]